VILVDANILIYAHVSSFAQHRVARDWLDQQLNGSGPVGLPWAVCHEYRRSKRRCATVREMKEGPSRSAIRC
jgi:predicted nucleic acid-binding protein